MNQKTSAQAAAQFAKVVDTDQQGRVRSVFIPGHEGKQYFVILRREGATISAECLLSTGNGTTACQGNSHAVCYHSMAAIYAAAGHNQTRMSWCASEQVARNLAHIGGRVIKVVSRQSSKVRWAVARTAQGA